jgi:hypothetical protein
VRTLLFVSLLLPATPLIATPVIANLQTGEWAMTTKMEIPGASYTMPPLIYRKCISNKMMNPSQINPGGKCTMLKHTVQGNTYSWHMRCTAESGITNIKGDATYDSDSMLADVHISSKKIQMVRHIHGRHVGPCYE